MTIDLYINEANDYAQDIGAPIYHPHVSVIHYDEVGEIRHTLNRISCYGIFMQEEFPEGLTYGIGCPSTLEGKTTLAMHYAQDGVFQQQRPHEDAGQQLYKAVEAASYAIGVDTRGTLLWDDNTTEIFGRPLLMILSEQASQEYLDYLKSKHISYITTGCNGIDLPSAMETLRAVFSIERLAVVGGGKINGSMLDLGLIDEVSMMYGYGIDGRGGMAAAFDGRPMDRKPVRLTFKSVEEQDGIVWIRYQVNNK